MSAEVEEDEHGSGSFLRSSGASNSNGDDDEKSIRSSILSESPSSSSHTPTARQSDFYEFDPNYDEEAEWYEDDSPYPEVRSAVANFDDPDMPVDTFRAWLLGVIWAVLLPGINQFLYFRYPSILVGGIVAQLITFPIGRIWARYMPQYKLFGIQLNPGPFNIKEHVLVTIMAGVGAQSAYAIDIVVVQKVWYHQQMNFSYQWMLVMSTQLIGFSIGGIARRLLVAPASMIWPSVLVTCALFNTLHSQRYAGIGAHDGMSRERFFTYAFLIAGFWYIVPGYLFQALSAFTWVCWIAPNNVVINQLFGYSSGMGLSLLSFDWNQIAFIGSPLATPWWAAANVISGFIIFFWIVTPALYFTNVWYSQYMPMSSTWAFDNRGLMYNITRILNDDATFNVQAYKDYSPLFLSTTFAIAYGLSFASITATLVHAILYFRKPISIHLHRSLAEQPDIHAQLMSKYPQIPEWWYTCIFGTTVVFACLCIKLWPTDMTIWAFIVALLIALLFIIPIGMIQAVTNRQVGLNVLTELIIGYMLPGRPVAMMMFKTWGYLTMAQAMVFTSDLKLGHYMKIPPRTMFWSQVIACVIAGTVQLGVMSWMFSNIPDLCTRQQADMSGFTCASTEVFATASVVWGVIGPALQFSKGQLYYRTSTLTALRTPIDNGMPALLFFFILGAVCPFLLWLYTSRYPNSRLHFINFPIVFGGVGNVPPATAVNFIPWALVGFLFQYVIRRRHFAFWAKYNYVLSAALDTGTSVSLIVIYFCLQFPQNGRIGLHTIQSWWGNTVFQNTADWKGIPLRVIQPDDPPFGPQTW